MTDEEAAERLDSLLDIMVGNDSIAYDKEDAEALRAGIRALRHNSERNVWESAFAAGIVKWADELLTLERRREKAEKMANAAVARFREVKR